MKTALSLILACSALLLAGCTAPGPRPGAVLRLTPEDLARLAPTPNPTVSLEEIVAQSQAGLAPEALIKRLSETGALHNLTPAQIVDLSRRGVDQKVIDYLADAQERARQATLITQLADRDAQAAAQLEHERQKRLYAQRFYDPFYYDPFWPRPFYGYSYRGGWNFGIGGRFPRYRRW